jgi:uncharacterized protein YcbK (DUF882 family)
VLLQSVFGSPEHNRAVGGASRQKHMDGTAFDIAISNRDPVHSMRRHGRSGCSASGSTRARGSCTSTSGPQNVLAKT